MNSVPNLPLSGEALTGVSALAYRNGMSRLGAAVNIVTTDGPAGRAGFAATAVCSVTDTPPTLLICLNQSSSVFDKVMENRALCVNVLAGDQEGLSNLFGGKTPIEERFAAANWITGRSGAPVLEGALATFDCELTDHQDLGSHRVLFCSVLDVGLCEDMTSGGLMYYDRGYHRVGFTD